MTNWRDSLIDQTPPCKEGAAARKVEFDTLPAEGTQTISFWQGEYDNKIVVLDDDATLTLDASAPGVYELIIRSDSATPRTVTWGTAINGSPATAIPDAVGVHVTLVYDGTYWFEG